jgi:hypothetical protein
VCAVTNFIKDAIQAIQEFGDPYISQEAVGAFDALRGKLARELPTRATSEFKNFEFRLQTASVDENVKYCRLFAKKEAPAVLSELAYEALSLLNPEEDEDRALNIVKASRELYAKFVFDVALLNAAESPSSYGDDAGDRAEFRRCRIAERDWLNADVIARKPEEIFLTASQPSTFASAHCFVANCLNGELLSWIRTPGQSSPTASEIFSALAFTWIDEALSADCSRALSLIAMAASMLHGDSEFAGRISINGAVNNYDLTNARQELARHAADARHAPNREKKAHGIAMYRNGNFSSKDKAAEVIANKLGVAFSTVRKKWLQGLE